MPGATKDLNVHRSANFPKRSHPIAVVTATGLTSQVIYSWKPGFKFQVVSVSSFCRTLTGAVSAVVKVGGRVAANVTFTAATEVAITLSTTLANLRGTATEALTIELTTDGTGALTNGFITVQTRPRPLNGDIGPI